MANRVLVSMTNGDIYYISEADAERLEVDINEQSSVLFITVDLKSRKHLRLQPLAVSSLVKEFDHA